MWLVYLVSFWINHLNDKIVARIASVASLKKEVLIWVSGALIKHQDQKQLGEEGCLFYLIFYHPGESGQELKTGTRRQELEQRAWRKNVYWLAPYGLLSLLSYTTLDHLSKIGPP